MKIAATGSALSSRSRAVPNAGGISFPEAASPAAGPCPSFPRSCIVRVSVRAGLSLAIGVKFAATAGVSPETDDAIHFDDISIRSQLLSWYRTIYSHQRCTG